ncbi:MAG: polyribonucleotide nucleotidyltransferase [Deltaproteobacteria bacterium]|nr:polyribonucleotide nucleotidyltransferase [Deltaproteobacteria bacterium]
MTVKNVTFKLGDQDITLETGKMAKQAGGSIVIKSADTVVLCVATSAAKPKDECDFLPLTVEYLEKTFAAGKIPGGFFKREGRPSEQAILTARFIDRPIRPLFPDNYYYDTQVISTVLSASDQCPPEMLAIIGSSAALAISDIPMTKPIAGCRVSRINGEFKINVTLDELEESDLNLVVAASEDAVVMVEGEAEQASEEDLLAAIEFAHNALLPAIAAQKELQKMAGKPKREVVAPEKKENIWSTVESYRDQVKAALEIKEKQERYGRLDEIKDEIKAKVITEDSTYADKLQLSEAFGGLKSELMRSTVVDQNVRIDGRGPKDIRPINCEVGLLPRAHGSALFTRGETQALVVATLGSADDEQRIDGLLEEQSKSFMLNYNFPAFSVGEVRPLRSPGRREIGHGHLAERALATLVPDAETFPYTIRIVSEILESNGSSSMASVCGGSLAMMDAGVPMDAPVAGIAMGLIKEGDKSAILSDILGDEDHLGDMDFKVTGTEKGVTALQMDIKIEGITSEIMKNALAQAKEGRLHILGKMAEALNSPREDLSAYAPRIESFRIPVDKIKDVIGSGGKNIRGIIDETGVKIDIEDDGLVRIFSHDGPAMQRAKEMVEEYTAEVEAGRIYDGLVKKVTAFGAFVEVLPKTEGLLHISQIANRRIAQVTDVINEGDRVKVKVLSIEPNGKFKLSMKEIDQDTGEEVIAS